MHASAIFSSVFFAVLIFSASEVSRTSAGDLGGMTGTVTDARTGTAIAAVHLRISSGSGAASATTDAKGHFAALSLPPDDHYTISLEKDGYYPRTLSGYAVYADQTQHYDLQLYPSASVSPTATPTG